MTPRSQIFKCADTLPQEGAWIPETPWGSCTWRSCLLCPESPADHCAPEDQDLHSYSMTGVKPTVTENYILLNIVDTAKYMNKSFKSYIWITSQIPKQSTGNSPTKPSRFPPTECRTHFLVTVWPNFPSHIASGLHSTHSVCMYDHLSTLWFWLTFHSQNCIFSFHSHTTESLMSDPLSAHFAFYSHSLTPFAFK